MPNWIRTLLGRSDPPAPASASRETIRVVHRTKPFHFEGVDRIAVLGRKLAGLSTVIPFSDPEVEEYLAIYLPDQHARQEDGSKPDYIHRFTDTDGTAVDFFVQSGVITDLQEPLSKYNRPA